MIPFVIGAAIGAVSTYFAVKKNVVQDTNTDNQTGNGASNNTEAEMYKKRNEELEQRIADLVANNQELHKKFKDADNKVDDATDLMESLKKQILNLESEKTAMQRELDDYKRAVTTLENKVKTLGNK